MYGEKKRTFNELQSIILEALKKRNQTIYEIAKKTSLHFNVVQHQLILLRGQDYVALVFEYNRFKLFAITEKGMKLVEKKKINPFFVKR